MGAENHYIPAALGHMPDKSDNRTCGGLGRYMYGFRVTQDFAHLGSIPAHF
jgi:hypothetical protein